MASGGNRIDVTLDCEQCKSRNYKTEKNRSNTPERLERRAFCRRCGIHTLHKESR